MKLFKKYKEDMMKIQEVRERYYEERFNRIGERIEKVLGKRVRGFFNKLVSKWFLFYMQKGTSEHLAVESGISSEEGVDYVLIDTPGKKKTLRNIKYLIVGLIALMILYGFIFDKWKLDTKAPKTSEED